MSNGTKIHALTLRARLLTFDTLSGGVPRWEACETQEHTIPILHIVSVISWGRGDAYDYEGKPLSPVAIFVVQVPGDPTPMSFMVEDQTQYITLQEALKNYDRRIRL